MNTTLAELQDIDSVENACARFGQILGLDLPVDERVLRAALENEEYAKNLLLTRRSRGLFEALLQSPPDVMTTGKAAPSNRELLGRAADSLVRWARSGFSTVDQHIVEQRLAACEACEFLSAPLDTLLYKVSLKRGEDKRSCGSCGCVVSRKARLASDTCPEPDPKNPGINRWGEPHLNTSS